MHVPANRVRHGQESLTESRRLYSFYECNDLRTPENASYAVRTLGAVLLYMSDTAGVFLT